MQIGEKEGCTMTKDKVLLLIEKEFEDMEAMYPFYRIQEAGFKVEVVAPSHGVYHGKYGYPIKATRTPGECNPEVVIGVVIPGGHAPDYMRRDPAMVTLVRDAMARGLTVGAICHGAQMLIEADVLRGKRATCYMSVKTDLKNAGAKYEDSEVVVDGNLVTSRFPADLPAFSKTFIGMLQELEPAA
jgi:protease I